MRHEPSDSDCALPPGAPTEIAPTEILPHPPTEVVRHDTEGPGRWPADQADQATEPSWRTGPAPEIGRTPEIGASPEIWPVTEIVRYGPGVPVTPRAGHAELTAERVWRNSGPGRPSRRRARLRRLAGAAVTVILLAASAVVLYLRFHHAPFHVTGVAIAQQTKTGCGVNVTGQIATNGSPGTVSYQWLFRPDPHAPQPLSQSVAAGQQAVYVTVAVQGSGQGSASQTVTLQILGPDPRAASETVIVSCP